MPQSSSSGCVVTEHGGVGDGRTDNTEVFRWCGGRCGTVVVPEGTFLTGAFNVSGSLVVRGTIRAVSFDWSTWRYHWPLVRVTSGYDRSRDECCVPWSSLRRMEHSALVRMTGEGAAVSGGGTIDGNGQIWWNLFLKRFFSNGAQYFGIPWFYERGYPYGRPRLVQIFGASDFVVRDVQLVDSPFWTLHVVESSRVLIKRVTILAPQSPLEAPNTDGIDVDSSQDVKISRVVVAVGDDAISIKSGLIMAKPSKNVVIEHSNLVSQWVSVGSEHSGGVDNVTIFNCSLGGTDRKLGADLYAFSSFFGRGSAGLHVKTRGDGTSGRVDGIRMVDSLVNGSEAALWISTGYPTEGEGEAGHSSPLGQISLESVRCLDCSRLVKAPEGSDLRIVRSTGGILKPRVLFERESMNDTTFAAALRYAFFAFLLILLPRRKKILLYSSFSTLCLSLVVSSSAPFAVTPLPVSAPWLRVWPRLGYSASATFATLTSFLVLYGQSRLKRRVLVAQTLFLIIALVDRLPTNAARTAHCKSSLQPGTDKHLDDGEEEDGNLLVLRCVEYIKLGEAAANAIGAFTNLYLFSVLTLN